MKKNNKKDKAELLEGSRAIALTVKNIEVDVVSAYPITPQTHIVEDLAKFKADGQANYEYILAESEFAAASIILGSSATGVRSYSATSSQGLLLMAEVVYNISGLRLPLVMTIANRAIGAPISIWNDHSDAMALKDSGWIMLFSENHQEAINQHILAYKIAEKLKLPVMVNVDGFILTHSYDSALIPDKKTIAKFLPKYKPELGTYLNPKQPITIGAFFTPQDFWLEKKQMFEDLNKSKTTINKEYKAWQKIFKEKKDKNISIDNGLIEYYGGTKAKNLIIAMGSVCGTIKESLKKSKDTALLKIKCFRPFPWEDIIKYTKNNKNIIVLEKSISLGTMGGPLFLEIKAALKNEKKSIYNYIAGLGGKDISEEMIIDIISDKNKKEKKINFI